MENDSIVITAKLNVDASEALIQKDLETLEGRLKSSPLKISCVINEDSISQMQSQLNSLTNNLTINLGNANIQSAKIEVVPDIKKGVLEQQAKELQKELGLLFPYGETEKLREELKGYLNEYQKAYQAENGYGEQAQAHMEKIVDFANKYRQEMVVINEQLKYEQDRVREIRSEQDQVFITAKQMAALNREAKQNGTTAQAMLNSVLPKGWYSDINKLPAGKNPRYWSDFANSVNGINPFHEIANEGDIVQGIKDLYDFMSRSFESVDNTIEKNRAVWEQWADTVRGSVGSITGQNPFANFFSEFEDITGETQSFANNMDNVQERVIQTVNVIQQSLGGNDGLSNVNFRISNQAIETFISELNRLDVQGINIDQLRERLQSLGVTITSISPKFAQVGRTGEQVLNTLTVKGVDSANNIVTYIENFNKKTGAFEESSTKVEQSFAKIRKEEERVKSETEALQKTYNDFLKLQGTFDLYSRKYGGNESLASQFETINNLIQGFDNTAPIDKQRESIIRIDSALKLLKVDIDEIGNAATQTATNIDRVYPNLMFSRGDSTTSILSGAKEQLNAYFSAEGIESTASRVKRAVEDASGSLNKFFVQVERGDKSVETLTYALNEQGTAYEYLGKVTREADNSTDFRRKGLETLKDINTEKINQFVTQLKEANLYAGDLKTQADGLKTSISQVANTNDLNRFLDDFDIAKAKFQALKEEAKYTNDAIQTIKRAYSEIASKWQPTITSLNSNETDIAIAKEHRNQLRELITTTRQRLEAEGLIDQTILDEIAHGEQLITEARDSAKAKNEEAEIKKREAEARKQEKQDLQDVNKLIKDNIAALEKFNNSTVAKNNKSNANVMGQVGINTDLITQLKAWQDSLKSDSSATNVAKVRSEINALGSSLQNAVTDSQNLNNALANTSAEATLEAKIKTLTNQMNAFALNNEKAITSLKAMKSFEGETFKSQWENMLATLGKGNLDAEGLKRLTEQFRIFKTEVQGTGQLTTSFADKMGSQLKMLASRWLSLYAVIGKIRTMINYVVELDTAMTKLKRVTDETAEGYERFLETAKKSAKETSTTLTDTVEQAARWAKSGYDAATSAELAKTSLIYSIVGDVDNETAVSDLVTVLRGFNMEAEDSLSIVDKLDALNNKYATDAKSLGEALSVSASAMASANNDLDQTLALITGASEITQNAKETGQAIRTITMRLRGRISCLHMGKLICI